MAKITGIEPVRKNPNRVNIYLDGRLAFDLAGIVAAWLRPGQDLDEAHIASLQADDSRELAFQRSLDFLSYRGRSEAEIRRHLRKHRVPVEVVEQTLARLRSTHLADDAQFARAWVENRTSFRPRSRRVLSWELKQKGIPAEAAESALAGLDEAALAKEAGRKQAARIHELDWREFRARLSAYLARRGFSSEIVASTVSELWSEVQSRAPSANSNEDIQ